MSASMTILAAGIGGVFCAMALLYLAIKGLSFLAARLHAGKKSS
jgi:Na+-transporting methylmalonyl-CoA/oxaloacetate decarboxylase gamma subunit